MKVVSRRPHKRTQVRQIKKQQVNATTARQLSNSQNGFTQIR
jgi:hypothetical protein